MRKGKSEDVEKFLRWLRIAGTPQTQKVSEVASREGVHHRTIQRDLDSLVGLGLHVHRERGRWRVIDPIIVPTSIRLDGIDRCEILPAGDSVKHEWTKSVDPDRLQAALRELADGDTNYSRLGREFGVGARHVQNWAASRGVAVIPRDLARKSTRKERELAVKLYVEGAKFSVIKEKTGMAPAAVVAAARNRGVEPNRQFKLTKEAQKEMAELREMGVSASEIADIYKTSLTTVYKWTNVERHS